MTRHREWDWYRPSPELVDDLTEHETGVVRALGEVTDYPLPASVDLETAFGRLVEGQCPRCEEPVQVDAGWPSWSPGWTLTGYASCRHCVISWRAETLAGGEHVVHWDVPLTRRLRMTGLVSHVYVDAGDAVLIEDDGWESAGTVAQMLRRAREVMNHG